MRSFRGVTLHSAVLCCAGAFILSAASALNKGPDSTFAQCLVLEVLCQRCTAARLAENAPNRADRGAARARARQRPSPYVRVSWS